LIQKREATTPSRTSINVPLVIFVTVQCLPFRSRTSRTLSCGWQYLWVALALWDATATRRVGYIVHYWLVSLCVLRETESAGHQFTSPIYTGFITSTQSKGGDRREREWGLHKPIQCRTISGFRASISDIIVIYFRFDSGHTAVRGQLQCRCGFRGFCRNSAALLNGEYRKNNEWLCSVPLRSHCPVRYMCLLQSELCFLDRWREIDRLSNRQENRISLLSLHVA